MKRVTDKRGYIIVEAAIFLPLFILAVVSLMYYINIISIQENVYNSVIDETARLSSRASAVKTAPAFSSTLKERINNENPVIDNAYISRFRYLYWDGDLDDMILVEGKFDMDLKLPLGFGHRYPFNISVKSRGFTGLQGDYEPMSFDEMEADGMWEPVWIFPASGEKFHDGSCTYVKANAKEQVLTSDLKRNYDPCELCGSESAGIGSLVYCFTENGTVYHSSDCRQVKRYVVEINKAEAVEKGYTSCSKCGGGIK